VKWLDGQMDENDVADADA